MIRIEKELMLRIKSAIILGKTNPKTLSPWYKLTQRMQSQNELKEKKRSFRGIVSSSFVVASLHIVENTKGKASVEMSLMMKDRI